MPESEHLGQSDTSRSPLYDAAKAVVDACEVHLARPWTNAIGKAVIALRHELAEADKALVALAQDRPEDEAEMRRKWSLWIQRV